MKTIHKYQVQPGSWTYMPRNAELLHVAAQGANLYVWARVSLDEPIVHRRLETFGTGWNVPEHLRYVGTGFVQHLVWHVFDGGEL